MKKIIIILSVLAGLVFIINLEGNASWQGPTQVLSSNFGAGSGQIGLESGDSGDDFPHDFGVSINGNIVIADSINEVLHIFDKNGVFLRDIKSPLEWDGWPASVLVSSECAVVGYVEMTHTFNVLTGELIAKADNIGGANYISANCATIYVGGNDGWKSYTPTGQIIKTYTTKPPELGKLYTQSMSNGQYQTRVVYPDMTYQMTTPFDAEKYYRDKNTNVYFIIGYTATLKKAATKADEDISVTTYDVHKYNSCGKKVGTLNLLPLQGLDANGDVEYEYGEPLVAYNGDIYTWRRDDDKYSILKWTWQDDPNTPTGPDAPANLKATAATTGLYLTWTASPQDPGCVTGYEISRSTTSGSSYSVIATVDKSILNYNDTTAVVGTTYYYKLRAKSGTDFSAYTAEASGSR